MVESSNSRDELHNEQKLSAPEPPVKSERFKRYSLGKLIDHGSFGVVYEAIDNQTGYKVAVKKLFIDHRYQNRELEMLQAVDGHQHILRLDDYYYSNSDPTKDRHLHIVSELMAESLAGYIKRMKKRMESTGISFEQIPVQRVRLFARQLFEALAYVHDLGIIHRDIKPANILLDAHKKSIKLCDWGSAKPIAKQEKSVSYICSRYYRAPELLFGCNDYNEKIDVWSAACVVAELLKLAPVFHGKSSRGQILAVFQVLGTPSSKDVLNMNKAYPHQDFPSLKVLPFETHFPPCTSKEALDFLKQMFVFDPSCRPSAKQALKHPFL